MDMDRFGIRNRVTNMILEGFFFTSLSGAQRAARATNEYRQTFGFAETFEEVVAFDRSTSRDYPLLKEPCRQPRPTIPFSRNPAVAEEHNPFASLDLVALRGLKKDMLDGMRSHQRAAKMINNHVAMIDSMIKAKAGSVPSERISEHAILRWLERTRDLDVEAVKAEIKAIIDGKVTGVGVEHVTAPSGEMMVCIVDGTVTTVLDTKWELPEPGDRARPSTLTARKQKDAE